MSAEKPFGTIALSLSGGGGRAAAFHLGTLAYLARVGLLTDVAVLSTVSGGSFVGATYALALARAKAGDTNQQIFSAYFTELTQLLGTATLMEWAFKRLASGDIHAPSGRQTLITALAEVYDDVLTRHARFGELRRQDIHLREIVFNATEFYGGLAFRFWSSAKRVRSGSVRVSLPDAHARHLRLADIIAASSCIPVGCEPLVFPDDFVPPDATGAQIWDSIRAEMRDTGGVSAVALMDGGVYDNQGMESVLEALRDPEAGRPGGARDESTPFTKRLARVQAERRQEYDNLGLFIVSDTPLACEELYEAPPPRARGRITLFHVSVAAWGVLAGCLASVVAILNDLYDPDTRESSSLLEPLADLESWFAYVLPLTLMSLMAVVLIRTRRFLRRAISRTPQVQQQTWSLVKHLKLRQIVDMIKLRTSSTWALTSSVYFNRIRLLGYTVLDLLPELKSRVIRHEIYDVLVQEEAQALQQRATDVEPSVAMTDIARRASHLQTKLWFDSPGELEDAIACGQFTMCYNLLAHLLLRADPGNEASRELLDRLTADWATLHDDAYAFVKDPFAGRDAPASPPPAAMADGEVAAV